MNKEPKKINTWLIVYRLNVKKTNFAAFHPFNKPIKKIITLEFNRIAIKEAQHIKYLGVILDSSLSWKQHILKISKSISNFCGIIYGIRPFVNNILTMLYNSLICSRLNYVAEVWTLTTKTLLNYILIIQKGLVRIMTFNNKR